MSRVSQERVVVVDDDDDVRRFVCIALEMDGRFAVVESAGSARQAVDAVSRQQPDAVLLDLTLPDDQGLSVVRRIHATAPTCRVVVFTGRADVDLARVRDAGGAAIVMKGEA